MNVRQEHLIADVETRGSSVAFHLQHIQPI